jgi:hypothetical protein
MLKYTIQIKLFVLNLSALVFFKVYVIYLLYNTSLRMATRVVETRTCRRFTIFEM